MGEETKPVMGGEPVMALATLLAVVLAGVGIVIDVQTLMIVITAVLPLLVGLIQRQKVTPVKKAPSA